MRALVVGDEVVGAMRRKAKQRRVPLQPPPRRRGQADRALPEDYVARRGEGRADHRPGGRRASTCSRAQPGPKVMEINSSPGFEGLERATGKDIAGAIIDLALSYSDRGRPAMKSIGSVERHS